MDASDATTSSFIRRTTSHLHGGEALDGCAAPALGEEGQNGLAELLEDRVLDGGLEAEHGLCVGGIAYALVGGWHRSPRRHRRMYPRTRS